MTKNNAFDRDQLVLDNLGLVEAVVNRLTANNAGAAIREDLVQEGNLALVEAANRYVPGPAAFSTYAWHFVAGAVRKALRNETTQATGHMDDRRFYRAHKVDSVRKRLENEGKDASHEAVAKAMGMDLADVKEALAYCDASCSTVSLDAYGDRDDEDFNPPPAAAALSVPSAENDYFGEAGGDLLDRFNNLSDKERLALRVRFGMGKFAQLARDNGLATFATVAAKLGVTTRGAKVVIDRAISKCQATYDPVPAMAA